MDERYINPFINSLITTFEMMMGLQPEPGKPYVKGSSATGGDITGVVGFAEKNVTGSVALSFPEATALVLYQAMTGEKATSIGHEVEDSIGEIANIVAGGAKTVLSAAGLSFHISIPSVIVGKHHSITHKSKTPVIVVPFTISGNQFTMEVSMLLYDDAATS